MGDKALHLDRLIVLDAFVTSYYGVFFYGMKKLFDSATGRAPVFVGRQR